MARQRQGEPFNHQAKPPDTMSTSGGVGGRGPQGPLLPDFLKEFLERRSRHRSDGTAVIAHTTQQGQKHNHRREPSACR